MGWLAALRAPCPAAARPIAGPRVALGAGPLAPRSAVSTSLLLASPARAPSPGVVAHALKMPSPLRRRRRHEKPPLSSSGKPVEIRMHVKVGDVVQVIRGPDKGKVGKVLGVFPTVGKILVEGANVRTKHVAGDEDEGIQSGRYRAELPIHHSNVMHFSAAHGVRSRVAKRRLADGTRVRVLVKTGEVLPN